MSKPTFINLHEEKLMDYYEKMMDEVFLQYHTHPSEIPAWANCGKDAGLEQTEYGNMASTLASQSNGSTFGQGAKHHCNPTHSNGMRRR